MKNKQASRRGRQNRKPVWPLLLALGGIVLVAAAVWAVVAASSQGSQKAPVKVSGAPSLQVDRESVDLGDVRLGEWVEVTFKLANVGDQPLRFSEAPYIEVVEGC